MFKKGFEKIALAPAGVTKNLQTLTGKPAQSTFGRPIRRFASHGRQALVGLTRLNDGLR
jgi:hypothetical protein